MAQINKTAAQIEQAVNDVPGKANIALDNLNSYTLGVDDPTPAAANGQLFKLDGVLATSDGTNLLKYARLDASGDLVAEIVPRTDSLAQLEQITGTEGELASSTDIPAIVQLNGASAPGTVFRPGQSVELVSVATSAASLPVKYDVVNVFLLTEASIALSLDAGLFEMQEILVVIKSSTVDVTSVDINGVIIALSEAIDTPEEMITAKLRWDGVAWSVIAIYSGFNTVTAQDSTVFGVGNKCFKSGSLVNGRDNVCDGLDSIVNGDGNFVAGRYGLASGLDNVISSEYGVGIGSGNHIGINSVGIGQGCYTAIKETATTTGSGPYTFALDSTTEAEKYYAVGDEFAAYHTPTRIIQRYIVISASGSQVVASGTIAPEPFVELVRSSSSKFSFLSGKQASATQIGQRSHAINQFTQRTLIQMTRFITADMYLTFDGNAETSHKTIGTSNRFIIPSGYSYVGNLIIQAKSIQNDSVAIWERRVVFGDFNNVASLKQIETVGTDFKDGAMVGMADPIIDVVDADNEFRIRVTRATGTVTIFHAKLELSEIRYPA